MATPSPGYAITVRVETPSSSGATSGLVAAVSSANGVLTALDVVESHADRLVVDVTCNASDAEHADAIVDELARVPGVTVRKVSDRTFLMHLGGKLVEAHGAAVVGHRLEQPEGPLDGLHGAGARRALLGRFGIGRD